MVNHILAWVFLLSVSVFLVPAFYTPERYGEAISVQMEEAASWYGRDQTIRIRDGADALYKTVVHGSGFSSLIVGLSGPAPTRSSSNNTVFSEGVKRMDIGYADYSQSLLLSIYQLCLRLFHTWIWVMYLLPFMLAIAWDGYMNRKVKLSSFRYTSPTVYNFSWHAIILIFAGAALFFATSLSVHTFVYPAIITLAGFLLRSLISNVQASV